MSVKDEITLMLLSTRIRLARTGKGWSQAQLAAQLKVSRSAVGHWERGQGNAPSTQRLLELARITGVSAAWLIDGIRAMEANPKPEEIASMPVVDREEERWRRCFELLSQDERCLVLELAEGRAKSR